MPRFAPGVYGQRRRVFADTRCSVSARSSRVGYPQRRRMRQSAHCSSFIFRSWCMRFPRARYSQGRSTLLRKILVLRLSGQQSRNDRVSIRGANWACLPLISHRMPDHTETSESDYSYSKRFPDARSLLQAQFERVNDALQDCIFVLDTNALLVPFGTGKESLEQIRRTYSQLVSTGRLVIPGQVVREFAVNRPARLAELHHALSQKQDIGSPKPGDYPLLEETDSFIEVQRLELEIRDLLKNYRKAVRDL